MNHAELPPGTVIAGDFRLVRLIDEGGMGAVYLAEQLSTGQRRALKVLHGRLASDATMLRRFEQEARVASRIHSDHVVHIVAAGVDRATGYPWLCMELLEGTTLEKKYPGAAPLDDLRLVMAQLGHALGAAHAAGIVHRDLKPENVFVSHGRVVGVPFLVKLLDFGIAKALFDGPSARTMMMGSPFWMAPEQYSEEGGISPATDVWALGLLAFRLLTGKPYWRTQANPSINVAAFLIEMSKPQLPLASERLAEMGGGALPPGFDAWFARCVAPTPALRFAEAHQATSSLLSLLGVPPSPSLATAVTLTPPPPSVAHSSRPPSASHSTRPPSSPPVSPRLLTIRFPTRIVDDVVRELGADLSLDGLWLRSRAPLPLGTPVRIDLRGQGDGEIASGAGVVGEIEEGRMFVRFSSLRGPLVDALARLRR